MSEPKHFHVLTEMTPELKELIKELKALTMTEHNTQLVITSMKFMRDHLVAEREKRDAARG